MSTIATVFTPTLLAVFAALALGTGAVLFLLSQRGGQGIDLRVPLSWAEPAELRVTMYLILGAVCGAVSLVFRLVYAFPPEGSLVALVLLVLVVLGFVANLAFFYAAMGSLLQAAFGTHGRPPFWFSRFLSPVDGAIMNLGDVLSGALFRPAPVRQRRAAHRFEDEYEDLEFEEESPPRRRSSPVPPRTGPIRRRRETEVFEEAEEMTFEDDPRMRRPARTAVRPARSTRRVPKQRDEAYEADADEEMPSPRMTRTRSRVPRDVVRERLDIAIEEYEASLTPWQLEKLQQMRTLVHSLKQQA